MTSVLMTLISRRQKFVNLWSSNKIEKMIKVPMITPAFRKRKLKSYRRKLPAGAIQKMSLNLLRR